MYFDLKAVFGNEAESCTFAVRELPNTVEVEFVSDSPLPAFIYQVFDVQRLRKALHEGLAPQRSVRNANVVPARH